MKNLALRMNIVVLLFFLNTLSAQTFNLQSLPSDRPQLSLRFLHPSFDTEVDLSAFSGVYEFSLNIPVSPKMNIIGIIPYVSAKYDVDFGFDTFKFDESGVGNIFIGLQTNPEIIDDKRSVLTYGLFLPTADEDVSLFGLYADYIGIQKYWPDALTLYFNYAHHNIKQNGLRFGLELGPNIIIPTGDNRGDTEAYLHYGISAGVQADKLLLNLELLGLLLITEDPDNFEDRFAHSINFGAAWTIDNVVPKVFYKIYLKEDIRDVVDGVLGIGISVSIH